jgi:murein DD-endopeptidase MepM/ murein hydrolase activator NlpD
LELCLPLNRKGRWLALNGPSNSSRHRRAISAQGGRPFLSQRFAIDWVMIDESEQRYRGDRLDNSSYYCYGADVLAVADGTVVEVRDGLPDNQPGSRPHSFSPETMAGNSVSLDLGQGQMAHYGHLLPESIVVSPGDKVRRGQRLARIGNSGNSTEPHLHFHVSGAGSWLFSDGLPYVFERFRVEGEEDHFSDLMPENQKVRLP